MSDPDVSHDAATRASSPEAAPSTETGSAPGASGNDAISPNSGETPSVAPTPLWLRRTDQIVVASLLIALVALLTIHWLRLSRWGTISIELTSQQPREYFYSLDINSASWVEWAQLDGIGEKLAKRIVANREEHGPFRDPNDVGRVRGIHAKQLESMKPFLRGGSAIEVAKP